MQLENTVRTINPGYEIASNGLSIAAIPSKSSSDIINDNAVVPSSMNLNLLLPIDLKLHKYFA